jgi:hypothetical protein
MVGTDGVHPDSVCSRAREGHSQETRGLRGSLFVRTWLAPDVALVASCITLFYCLFLFQGYQKLFRDSDAGWHIRTGERILATGVLPRTDPYSFTRAGEPWFAWEWGADILTGAVHSAWGLAGVAMLYGVAIAAGVWLWFRLHWAVSGNFLIASLLAIPLLSTCNIHWLARPHVLSWLFLLAAMLAAHSSWPAGGFTRRQFWAIALFSAAWTNIHASFFFAPLIAAIFALSHFLRPLIWTLDRISEWRRAGWFAYAGLVAAAASLVNPYGWQEHVHVFRYITDSNLLHRVGEFQSFDFQAAGAGQILLTVAIAMLGGVLALTQKNLAHFLLAVVFVAAGIRSARSLPLVALLLLPLANGAITKALADCKGLQPRLRHALDEFLAYSDRLRAMDRRMCGVAWAPVILFAMFALLRMPAIAARTGFPLDQFPVKAAAELEKLPGGMRLLAPDKFGGYLIYRFQGRIKVFFDGRSDFYGADFLKRYARLVQVRPGWETELNKYDFTHALLPNDYSLVAALEQIGWRVLYRDGTATLLARPMEIAGSSLWGNCGAANPGCSRLSAGCCEHASNPNRRLKAGCGHDCPPHMGLQSRMEPAPATTGYLNI